MDAVGLGDLDLGQSGGGEGVRELVAGKGAGDAAGPCGHVGAGGLVHVVVGDDIGDGEAAAGAQDAGGFAQDRGLSAERLITQFEITTSTVASGSGMCSM